MILFSTSSKRMYSQFCQEILSHAGHKHSQSQNVAHSVLPSEKTKRSQSPDCVLLKAQHGSFTSHEGIQYKVTL